MGCGGRSIIESSQVGSSTSNGFVERGIQSVQARISVFRSALERRLGAVWVGSYPIWPCRIEYSAIAVNRGSLGRDGNTLNELNEGKTSAGEKTPSGRRRVDDASISTTITIFGNSWRHTPTSRLPLYFAQRHVARSERHWSEETGVRSVRERKSKSGKRKTAVLP